MKTSDTTLEPGATSQSRVAARLPLGLLGFESLKDYILETNPDEAPFKWLQAVGSPLAFLLLSPFECVTDYELNLEDEVDFLRLESAKDALVYCITTLHPDGTATTNLKGPIVFNRHTMVGKQVVLAESTYPLQFPLPPSE